MHAFQKNEPHARPRLLLAEDDELLLRALTKGLGREFEVIPVDRGDRIVQAARQQPADLALLDVRMPGMSGIEAAERLGEIMPHLPVILMSAEPPPPRHRLPARPGNVRLFLQKPFDLSHVVRLLHQIREPG
jgi:CheY-like chemotaxis protein